MQPDVVDMPPAIPGFVDFGPHRPSARSKATPYFFRHFQVAAPQAALLSRLV